jgi:oligopeptide/dipeptide ABC transporter ATP-binding protein
MNELLQVRHLKKFFPLRGGFLNRVKGHVHAVNDVSFTVKKGETFGIVGESGCGKTTLARAILRLIEPTDGEILFEGKDLCHLDPEEMRSMRREMQIIFQDPFASLNPRMTIEYIIREPLEAHTVVSGPEKKELVAGIIEKVGLRQDQKSKYPVEFSGGQRQRVGIARALVMNPKLVIGDEPVSALDVSIRAQIINLLEKLKEDFDLSYIIISHDLTMVEHISGRVGVMYLGKMVEMANCFDLYENPLHPYTKALLSATPLPNPRLKKERFILEGDVPSPIDLPPGCFFHPRCPSRKSICGEAYPDLMDVGNEHFVACHGI